MILYGATQAQRAAQIDLLYPRGSYVLINVSAAKTSILISQIQALLHQLSITARLPRLVWIEEAQQLTLPAQQALLKILEEPPSLTEFVLSLDNRDSLLPTIRSRCQFLLLEEKPTAVDFSGLTVLKEAMASSSGRRLTLADSLGRQRESALLWTRELLAALGSKLAEAETPRTRVVLSQLVQLVQQAYTDLLANCQVSLVLQHLFLKLPKTRS